MTLCLGLFFWDFIDWDFIDQLLAYVDMFLAGTGFTSHHFIVHVVPLNFKPGGSR